MIEDAQTIFDYLPISYGNPTYQEYVDFLWDAFATNYSEKPVNSNEETDPKFRIPKYNFSFLAYHMLFMTFIYFEIWQIKNFLKEDFEKALVGFEDREIKGLMEEDLTPFAFKQIKEKVVFRFLKLIGLSTTDIGNLKKLADERDNTAHPQGTITFKDHKTLDSKINDYLRCIKVVQNHSGKIVKRYYEKFLLESADLDNRQGFEDENQIREVLVYSNHLSIRDIDILRDYDHEHLKDNINYENIVSLTKKLKEMYPNE